MKTHTLSGIGLTALILGGFAVGGIGVAKDRTQAAITKDANVSAARAAKALGNGDAADAVPLAEAAVALLPQDVGFRMLLGQSYLKAGRFTSAHQAFADVLTLSPDNGKAALNMALAQIAEGQWADARQTLAQHQAVIPATDLGLAIALAGDPRGGIEVLMTVARSTEVTAKTRQNLALAYALAGQWREAKSLVEVDVSPVEAQKRLVQWVDFVRPTAPSDQVATLLGVVAAQDQGRPVTLALNAPVAMAAVTPSLADPVIDPAPVADPVVESATVQMVPDPAPVMAASLAPTPVVETAAVVSTPVADTPVTDSAMGEGAMIAAQLVMPRIIFAERSEVVQALPPKAVRAVGTIPAKGAFKTRVAAFVPMPGMGAPGVGSAPAKGDWYVQLGAFDNAGVAKDAWVRATRRYAALGAHSPAGTAFKGRGGSFYRLSVGGFARADAVAICHAYRVKGGTCFVRTGAGDSVARWVKPVRQQLASR